MRKFYLASLALGVLEAMKQGVVHPEMGIWSLGRLQCSQQFENSPMLFDISQICHWMYG